MSEPIDIFDVHPHRTIRMVLIFGLFFALLLSSCHCVDRYLYLEFRATQPVPDATVQMITDRFHEWQKQCNDSNDNFNSVWRYTHKNREELAALRQLEIVAEHRQFIELCQMARRESPEFAIDLSDLKQEAQQLQKEVIDLVSQEE